MPLPKQIEIGPSTIPGEKLGVFSTMWIKEGTQMGPYTGRVMPIDKLDMKQLNNFVWEVRSKNFQDKPRVGKIADQVIKI